MEIRILRLLTSLILLTAAVSSSAQEYPIGVSLSLFGYQETTQEQVQSLRDAGVQYVEVVMNQIMRYHPESEWYQRAWTLKNRLESAGLTVWSVHLPHTENIDISFTDPKKREYSLQKDEEAIRIASIFSARRIILHPSNDPVKPSEREVRMQYAKNGIGRLAIAARSIGAVLCVEDLPRTNLGRNSEEILELIGSFPDVKCCFDSNHLMEEDQVHFINALGSKIASVHLSDYDRVDEKHWIEGSGVIDWKALYAALQSSGYDGVAMHEVRGGSVCAKDIIKAYKEVVCGHQADEQPRRLIAMGNSFTYIIDPEVAKATGSLEKATVWKWDARSIAGQTGIPSARLDFTDECKVKEGGEKLLITGAHGWCVLLRKADRKPLFWTSQCDQAHSAELLPCGRVVVACSVPKDALQLYDLNSPEKVILSIPYKHAHGVYYSEKYKRLFAVGENVLSIYSLDNWDSDCPALKLERSIPTGWYVSDVHDLVPKDEDTLILTGNNAAFYDIRTGTLTHWSRFRGIRSIKSMNYNNRTGEIIYTYSNPDVYEGEYNWATQRIRTSYDLNTIREEQLVPIPGINGYKTRVYNW